MGYASDAQSPCVTADQRAKGVAKAGSQGFPTRGCLTPLPEPAIHLYLAYALPRATCRERTKARSGSEHHGLILLIQWARSPASQTTEARTAEAVGAGPEPLTVAVVPVEDRTAKGVAAEPVSVEKAPGHYADINGSGIEE